jgi:AAA domain/Bifunctional DNA primase/polymerase, N-terminal
MSFDPDFADPTEWARMYRGCGLQVVPAMSPRDNKTQWKRPALPKWRALEHELTPDFSFERWYGDNGEHARRYNMGLITGACSGGVFVVDLDLHKNPAAQAWWYEMLDLQQGAGDLETAEQATGGGGVQLFFRAPANWTPPTCKTSIGVDIRGQGGFAMMPPSMHESGKNYRWKPGLEPWSVEIAEAPMWLCEQITSLAREHGGSSSTSSPAERTKSPTQATDAFGRIVDGREEYMTRLVWARVVQEYRESPIMPGQAEQDEMLRELFSKYERATRSRIVERGTPNHILLEREGRGITLFKQKWRAAFDQWDGKVREHAGAPPPQKERPQQSSAGQSGAEAEPKSEADAEDPGAEFRQDFNLFELLSVVGIKNLPDPKWLAEGMIIDLGLGFFFGPPGCGKSFIAQNLALSIACGLGEWWGRKILRKGPVIYISSEGVGDIKFRLRAWENHMQVNADEAPFYLIRQTINFMLDTDVNKLLLTINTLCEQLGELPVMIVVDTVSRVLPGADENLQKDMTLFIKACDEVRETFGATVVGVHHTSRAGNMRGSTVFDGAGDFLFGIERDEGNMIGTMTAKKIKAAQDGWKQAFELKEVSVDLKGTTSLVALSCEQHEPEKSVWPPRDVCNKILSEIGKAWASGNPWSSKPQTSDTGRYAPDVIKAQFDVPVAVARLMVKTWLDNKVLSYEMVSKKTKMYGLRVIGSID